MEMRDVKPFLTADHHLPSSSPSSPALLPFFPGQTNLPDDSTFFTSFDSTTTLLQPLLPFPYDCFPTSSSPNFNLSADDYPALAYTTPAHHLLQFPDDFSSSSALCFDSQPACDSNLGLLDFFSRPAPDLFCNPGDSSSFTHLPHLQSIEHAQLSHSSSSLSARKKRARVDPAAPGSSQSLDSILQSSFNFQGYVSTPPLVTPQTEVPRQRRPRISDKTRSLQKLMPSNKKMDTATLLEDAYKYVEFLQAQIKALQWMPVGSSFGSGRNELGAGLNNSGLGSLEALNRQQLLQVMVNSPVAQTMLYSKGFCVFSQEQLLLLRRIAQKKTTHLEQMLFDPRKSCR